MNYVKLARGIPYLAAGPRSQHIGGFGAFHADQHRGVLEARRHLHCKRLADPLLLKFC